MFGTEKMYEIIGKNISKTLESNIPINNQKPVFTDKQIKHFYECKKPNCNECKEIMTK